MTPDALEALVRANDPAAFVAALAELDDRERRALSKAAAALCVQIRREEATDISIWRTSERLQCAQLAILACCGLTEARKVKPFGRQLGGHSDFGGLIADVLTARRPSWAEKWVKGQLTGDREASLGFLVQCVSRLVRAGVIARPATDDYIIALVRAPHTLAGEGTLRDRLERNPELLENEIWRIFEVDPRDAELIHPHDVEETGPYSWARTLRELSEAGCIDRQRLLDESLDALGRGLHPRNTRWHWLFHEVLEPTSEEREARQERYLALLDNPVDAVVGFAVKSLAKLARAKRLDCASLCAQCEPAFRVEQKGPARAMLRLLSQAAKIDERGPEPAAIAAADALLHSDPDLHGDALDAIEGITGGEMGEAVAAALRARLDDASAAQRARIAALIDAAPSAAARTTWAEAVSEADRVDPRWSEPAGVIALLRARERNEDPPAVGFDPMAVPRLDPGAALDPIEETDELIDALHRGVHRDPEQFERALDGISRLCDVREADLERRAAPLLDSVTDEHGHPVAEIGELVHAWLVRNPKPAKYHSFFSDRGPVSGDFVVRRVHEVSNRVHKKKPAPLLAAPTHRGGWIDPRAFAERLWTHRKRRSKPDTHDLIQALLRLAPDHRDQARESLARYPGMPGRVARWALGAAAAPKLVPLPLWIAACRARAPFEDTPTKLFGGDVGPDAAQAARYRWSTYTGHYGEQDHDPALRLDIAPRLGTEKIASMPTLLLHHHEDTSRHFFAPYGSEALLMWPPQPEPLFAIEALDLVEDMDKNASAWRDRGRYLRPLLDPDTAFREMAQLLLALALASKDSDVRVLAVDAMIAAAGDGRCTGSELGGVWARLVNGGLVKPSRIADALTGVAATSRLHAHVCARASAALLMALETPWPRSVLPLLSQLNEWLAASGEPTPRPLRQPLELLKRGRSKTARAARNLLARPSAGEPAARDEMYAEALRARIARAERWAARG